MTDNTCKTCRYWTASGLIGTRQSGKCLKNAPTVSPQGITWWPDVTEDQWCGKHTPKPHIPEPEAETDERNTSKARDFDLAPMSVYFDVPAGGGSCMASFWPPTGRLRILGIRSFNNPNEVELVRITTGTSELNLLAGPVDSAAYRCDDRRDYWRVDWGRIQQPHPIHVTAKPFGKSSVCAPVQLVLYGEFEYNIGEGWPVPGLIPCRHTEG